MAQTIAMYRGTGSLASGTTNTTLFTQSGGSATRVISNSVVFYVNAINQNLYASVTVTPSTGVAYVVGHGLWTAAGVQFTIADNVSAFSQSLGATPAPMYNFAQITQNTVANYAPGNVVHPYDVTINTTTSNTRGGGLPGNFWIGSGDSVVLRINSATQAITAYSYSFTTITES